MLPAYTPPHAMALKTILDLGTPLIAVLMMVAVGLELEVRHFRELMRRKGMFIAVLAGQAILLPLIGWMLTRLIALPPHLTAGLLLLAACPVGDIANFYVMVARANLALSVALNTISCLLSVVTMTATFAIYHHGTGGSVAFGVPTLGIVSRLLLLVAAPILAGMTLRHYYREFAAALSPKLKVACVAVIIPLIALVVAVQGKGLVAGWPAGVTAVLAMLALAAAAGFGWSRLLRLSSAESATVAIAFPVRNVVLAVTVAVTLLNRLEYALFAVFYFVIEVPVLLLASAILRRRGEGAQRS